MRYGSALISLLLLGMLGGAPASAQVDLRVSRIEYVGGAFTPGTCNLVRVTVVASTAVSSPLVVRLALESSRLPGPQVGRSRDVKLTSVPVTGAVATFDQSGLDSVVTATVDATNAIRESNEGNNVLSVRPSAAGRCPTVALTGGGVVSEGGTAQFKVNMDRSFPRPVTVRYATRNGSAGGGTQCPSQSVLMVSPPDYLSASGTITFPAGQAPAAQLVSVTVCDEEAGSGGQIAEGQLEPDQTFDFVLSSPVNALISPATATVTIRENG